MFKKWAQVGRALKRELRVHRFVLKDPRTPRAARWLLAIAVGYALLPFDLIPDCIPNIGHLDDLILVPMFVILALKLVPTTVIADCRERACEREGTVLQPQGGGPCPYPNRGSPERGEVV